MNLGTDSKTEGTSPIEFRQCHYAVAGAQRFPRRVPPAGAGLSTRPDQQPLPTPKHDTSCKNLRHHSAECQLSLRRLKSFRKPGSWPNKAQMQALLWIFRLGPSTQLYLFARAWVQSQHHCYAQLEAPKGARSR